MTTKKNQRPQAQKSYVSHVQNLRGGSTAQPHKPKTDYRRKPKHPGKGWDF
jgi:hypothetical protein